MQDIDIIFLSYNESNGDKNWIELKSLFPKAKRVHGVRGIHQAHLRAAEVSETDFFFVVDGDNRVTPTFDFKVKEISPQFNTIYVWRCLNPVNGLIYGYGAVKLYNKTLVAKKVDSQFVDLAMSHTKNYQVVHELASSTHFNHTPEEAWRAGFRECAKLQQQCLKDPKDQRSKERLDVWCSKKNLATNSDWVLLGATQGREFALQKTGEIHKINDFQWLKEQYNRVHS